MKTIIKIQFFIFLVFFSCEINPCTAKTPQFQEKACTLLEEVNFLKKEFKKFIPQNQEINPDYKKEILEDAQEKLIPLYPEFSFENQYFIYIDRSPAKQILFVCYFDSEKQVVGLIGIDKISTGDPKRNGYFMTPKGVFTNSLAAFGYRALGTKNAKGWMGLGEKGSRVWDLGWQVTDKKKNSRIKVRKIRLLLHATDPIYGEKRLGTRASQGCIRISQNLNFFLDHFGIIDHEFEFNSKQRKTSWLLNKDREPVLYAGKYVIVADSQ